MAAIFSFAAVASAQSESIPVKASLSILETTHQEDGDAIVEYPFNPEIEPRQGRQLRLHVRADNDCRVLITILSRDPVHFYRNHLPEMHSAPGGEVKMLPEKVWGWEEPQDAFDLFLVFFHSEEEEAIEIFNDLIEKSHEHREDLELLNQLAMGMNRQVKLILAQSRILASVDLPTTTRIGGARKELGDQTAVSYDWEKESVAANFRFGHPGILLFEHREVIE